MPCMSALQALEAGVRLLCPASSCWARLYPWRLQPPRAACRPSR